MAAEIAAGAWVAEEVVSTTAQVGVAAYMVSKPTMPLKATFTQIATSSHDETRFSLARSNHSLTIVGEKAYIFGGTTSHDKLASNEIHAVTLAKSDKPEPDYAVLPAIPDVEGGKVPAPRSSHAACAFNVCIAVYGGSGESGNTLADEGSTIWLYNTAKSAWETLVAESADSAPGPRSCAKLFNLNNNLLLYGGRSADGQDLKDVWYFDYAAKTWNQLPSAPVTTSNAALANGTLHLIAGADSMSSDLHIMNIPDLKTDLKWEMLSFPTNPLTPGPRPRSDGGLLPITTGFGRNYLLYFFGARQGMETTASQDEKSAEPTQWSDMWTFQISSSEPEMKATTSISDAIKPARIKDAIRSKLGYDSGGHSWGEVEVLPPTDLPDVTEGKVHPGPRRLFGCDVMEDGRTIVLWGGENAKGEREGDGWSVKLE